VSALLSLYTGGRATETKGKRVNSPANHARLFTIQRGTHI